jgi:hypothetical protein
LGEEFAESFKSRSLALLSESVVLFDQVSVFGSHDYLIDENAEEQAFPFFEGSSELRALLIEIYLHNLGEELDSV